MGLEFISLWCIAVSVIGAGIHFFMVHCSKRKIEPFLICLLARMHALMYCVIIVRLVQPEKKLFKQEIFIFSWNRRICNQILQWDSAIRFCNQILQSDSAIRFCNQILQSYSAIRFCNQILQSDSAIRFCNQILQSDSAIRFVLFPLEIKR